MANMKPEGQDNPDSATTANGRILSAKAESRSLHNKLIAIRNGKQGHRIFKLWYESRALSITSAVILNLAFAAEKDKLNHVARLLFKKLSRAEILCLILEEVRYSLHLNRQKYGTPKESWVSEGIFCKGDPEIHHIARLTREEVTEKYGAEDWHSRYRRYRPYDKVSVSDVKYARFLCKHNLSHRYGSNVTEADLPPIEESALVNDPYARREAMLRFSLLEQ
jgi:hypothetical protein